MPEWLTILLAICGALNVIGFVAWIVKMVYEIKNRLSLVEKSQASLKDGCKMCDEDKREMFRTLKRLDRVNVAIATKLDIDLSKLNTNDA